MSLSRLHVRGAAAGFVQGAPVRATPTGIGMITGTGFFGRLGLVHHGVTEPRRKATTVRIFRMLRMYRTETSPALWTNPTPTTG
jgi:hypothetical protein